jgi:hypothetical protein
MMLSEIDVLALQQVAQSRNGELIVVHPSLDLSVESILRRVAAATASDSKRLVFLVPELAVLGVPYPDQRIIAASGAALAIFRSISAGGQTDQTVNAIVYQMLPIEHRSVRREKRNHVSHLAEVQATLELLLDASASYVHASLVRLDATAINL